jgi:flagellar motor switch protein FliM
VEKIFTPDVLDQLKQQVSQSLTDTFAIMFNLNLMVRPLPSKPKEEKALKAFVEFKSGGTTAFLNVTLPTPIVEKMMKALDLDNKQYTPEIGQDVTCEVINIVGHSLLNYFANIPGTPFVVGMPQIGSSAKGFKPPDAEALNLHFFNGSDDAVDVDFIYPRSA